MHAQKNKEHEQGRKQKKPFRRIAWLIGIPAGIVLILGLTAPWLLSSSGGTAFLLGRINRALDGTLDMEDLSVGWLSGVRIKNLSFEDTAGQTQVRVDSITAHPKLFGLLGGRLALEKTVIDRPDVKITLSESKPPAPEAKTQEKPKAKGKEESAFLLGPVDLEVREGRAVIEQLRPVGQPLRLEVRNFASTVQLREPGKESSLDVSMKIADGPKEASIQARGAVTNTSGSWGLKGLSGQLEMEVDSLSLGSLRPLLALAGKDVEMAGTLNADADLRISDGQIDKLSANAVLENFQQTIAGKVTRLEQPVKAEARISSKGDDILIDALSVNSSFCHLDGKGGLNALDYTLTADLAKTQEVAASLVDFGGYQLKGAFTGSGKLRRDQDTITAAGQHEVRDFSLRQGEKSFALATVAKTYALAVNPSAQTLRIQEASVNADPVQIQITNGLVNWSGEEPEVGMKVSGNMDLQKARPIVDFFHPLPAEVSVAGRLRPDFSVEMKEGKARIRTELTAIDDLKVARTGMEPFVSKTVSLKADAVVDLKNKTLQQLSGFELISDPIKLRGRLEQTAASGLTTLSGLMDAEYDLKNVTTIASPYLPEGLNMEGARNDRFEFRSQYPSDKPEEKMENLQASGKFGFDKADYKGLHIGPAEVKLRADQGMLAVDLADTAVNEGTLRFAGDIDLKAEPKMLRLRKPMKIIEQVHINDELTQNLLEYVNPFFAGATRVSGIGDFSCDELVLPLGRMRKDLLKMKAVLGIRRLQMRPGGFLKELLGILGSDPSAIMTLHPTEMLLRDQVLSYQNMQLDVGDNPVNFAGQVGLDKRLKLNMRLPWTLSGKTIRSGQDAGDRIALSVGGTVNRPEVDWGKVIQMNLGRLILQEILK